MRHTYATEMLRGGMSLPTLMRLLGHKSITMTLRYAAVSQADVRTSYFTSLASLRERYSIPAEPTPTRPPNQAAEPITVHLNIAVRKLESLRRDERDQQRRKKLDLLTRRLRRILTECDGLASWNLKRWTD